METRRQHGVAMRVAALTAVGAAAALALAFAISGGAGNRSAEQKPTDSTTHPTTPAPTLTTVQPARAPTTGRPIVYSDIEVTPGTGKFSGDSIHVGDRLVDTGSGWVKMDATDDGVVYTTGGYEDDGRVWFTDGGAPDRIGTHACVAPHGAGNTVVTANTGSLAAWLDCTRAKRPDLVVYDTRSTREVVREPMTECIAGNGLGPGDFRAGLGACTVDALIGDHVYFTWWVVRSRAFQFDMATNRVMEVRRAKNIGDGLFPFTYDEKPQAYLDDIRSHPRGLVIGTSWESGQPMNRTEFFVVGQRLTAGPGVRAFDTATHRPVRLHVPSGYQGAASFALFEWLDDDSVALIGPTGWGEDAEPGYGDILACRLSDGHCDLVAPGRGPVRLAANGTVPN
jgi:hypothetical protein